MAQKIILFVSPLSAPAKAQLTANSNAPGDSYKCPNGEPVYGLQTNEAPVKFLLRKYPDVSEILCLVTPVCRKVPDGGGQSAWERFKKTIEDTDTKAKLEPFDFTEDNPPQESVREMISNILRRIDSKDEILLETTGGFRNAIMYLLLISRALSYKGVETTYAVYSNLQTKEIEDVTPMLKIFDLIDGMQNLTSFGNVRKLQEYYKDCKDDKINTLLTEANRLWEYITLCRPNPVPEQIEKFNQALDAAEECNDPLLRALLPAFRSAFEGEMTIPRLIRWCAKNDMIQQALTLYRQCIPDYILNERTDILSVASSSNSDSKNRSVKVEKACSDFDKCLRRGGALYKRENGPDKYKETLEREDDYTLTLTNFEQALDANGFTPKFTRICSPQDLHTIAVDFLYILTLRNMADHADDQVLGRQQALSTYLVDEEHYKRPETTNVADVKKAILDGLDHLLAVQPQTP